MERANRTPRNNSNNPMFITVCLCFFKRYLLIYYKHLLQSDEKRKCTGCGTNLSFVRLVLKEISFMFFTGTWLYQKTTVHNFGIISRTFLNTARRKRWGKQTHFTSLGKVRAGMEVRCWPLHTTAEILPIFSSQFQ